MRIRIGILLLCMTGHCHAQPAGKKADTLHGTVEKVDGAAKKLSVANQAIPGGMGAMTMDYSVDRQEMFSQIKAGDRITAKFYEGDMTLYDIRIDPAFTSPKTAMDAGMRLEEFERLALANNPTIAQAQANVRVSAGRARQAGLYPNPTIGYYGDEIRGGYYSGGKQGGFFSQTVVTGGKLKAARRVAQLLSEESETEGSIQKQRILNDDRTLFYQVLANQKLVEVRQNLAKLAADATQTSYQLANVGQADRPDVLQSEVEQQQVAVSLRNAEQMLQASWRALSAVSGKPGLPQTTLAGDLDALPDLNYEEWLATTLKDSPEVKLAQQAAIRAEASLSQAKMVPIPDLQLSGNLTQNYEPLETTHRPVGVNAGAQIGVTVPLFNRNQGNIAAAKAEVESTRQDVIRVKLQIAREVANRYRDYDSARTTALQYRDQMIPRAEQAYRLYRANYRNMAAAYPQALISQRTLFQLQVDYVQALEAAWRGALMLQGFGLMDGLSAPAAARVQ